MNEGNALPSPKRQCIYITLGIGCRCIRSIADDWPTRFRGGDDLALTGPLARRWTPGGFPSRDSAIAQYTVRSLWPADVE